MALFGGWNRFRMDGEPQLATTLGATIDEGLLATRASL